MLRPLYIFLFWLFGWRVSGTFPSGIKKYIVAVAPHTSNIDFMIGVAVRSIMRMQNARFLAKSTLFKGLFGWVFKFMGGYPVDRRKNTDIVGQVVEIFEREKNFILAIAPEGTRQKVAKLKTGFYYIAKQANVPIVPCGFDYRKKVAVIGAPFSASDNIERDIETLTSFFRNITGKNPERGIS